MIVKMTKTISGVMTFIIFASYAYAVEIEWVTVGNAGNTADTRYDAVGYGSVDYEYQIGKYEVTNAQYTEFLNAVAKVDTYDLYNIGMATSGIVWNAGANEYQINSGWENKPVNYVSWVDSLRFANWINNGQPTGQQDSTTTEDGAYTFIDAVTVSTRNPDAKVWLPNEDEWYKSAYFDGDLDIYYDYAVGSNSLDTSKANYDALTGGSPVDVGSYPYESFYGTYDQTGNIKELNETTIPAIYRGVRGGSFMFTEPYQSAEFRGQTMVNIHHEDVGFRLASEVGFGTIPEPLSVLLLLFSLCGLIKKKVTSTC